MLKKLKKFFSSMFPLLILAFSTSIIAIVYAVIVRSSTAGYSFYSYNEYVSISSGVVMFTTHSNLFEGNNITYYAKDDIKVVEYKMGYYIVINKKYLPIIETSAKLTSEKSLKEIVNNIEGFDFIEPSRGNDIKITNKYRSLINSSLYFVLKYKTKDATEYTTISSKVLMTKID